MVEKTDLIGINLESHLYNLIYEIPLPPLGGLLKFHIGCKAIRLHLPDHANANDLPLFDYDLGEFFRLLGVSNVINLYITALLEHQIILYSKDYNLLMLVAESLSSLFFPFTWLKPYVPLVPASNLHFIEAPVPYIMGFHHRDIDKEFFKQGQRCFVDIDSGTVSCPEGLPEFPDKNKFIKEINDLIVYFGEKRSQCVSNKKRPSVDIRTTLNRTENAENIDQLALSHSLQTDNSTCDILQNSQAFARVTELARKAGAFNDECFVDTTTGRLKTLTTNFVRFSSTSSSSGVSSASSNLTDELSSGIDSLTNFFSGSNLLKKIENENVNTVTAAKESLTNEPKIALDDETLSMQFTRCIRELFLQRFVQMFVSYEKFVIVPNLENNKIESWWMSREYSGNFDSKMFLIEQPSPRLPFLSHFIATQMFVTFIDLKIISLIDPKKTPDPNVKVCSTNC
jgi:DENN domain-containing protein 5